ncbi:ISL3 family transposase [Streptomyces sp. NPDC048275]|uniref:ISL3 family transposase n=1 Tax=Streptomyces sp. NPDC048275 TaxID=3155629 RepID=UPI0033D980BC
MALAGRAGARIAAVLAVAVSRVTLISLLTALPDPPATRAPSSPRVLGVDDFAFRKGSTYGTILVDVDTSAVIDLLPDRSSETLTAWLADHPGAEIICRDRDSSYSRAATAACPDATQVADRFHLLQGLYRAVEKVCHQHRSCLKKHAEHGQDRPIQMPLLDALPPTLIVQRVLNRHAEINRMVATGYPVSEITRRLSLDRKTVRHYRDTDLDMLLASARDRRSVPLDRFKPFLQAEFARGNTSGTALFEQLREQGYQGGYFTLTRYLRTVHAGTAPTAPAELPRPRRFTGWITQTRESLSPRDAAGLDEVRLACPDIAAACDFARAFTDLLRHRRGFLLHDWIRQAEQTAPAPVKSFAGFLRQDIDAVLAGLTSDYSSGVVEGHVNRLKTLKRQMFNRAGPPLLRKRVLLAASFTASFTSRNDVSVLAT